MFRARTSLFASQLFAVGDIPTYPGYGGAAPTTAYATVTDSISLWTDLPTATRPTYAPGNTTAVSYPLANDTPLDCFYTMKTAMAGLAVWMQLTK